MVDRSYDGGGRLPLTSLRRAFRGAGTGGNAAVLVMNDLRSHRRADRQQAANWPRRGDCSAAGRGRIWFLDGSTGFDGLHYDAQMP